MIECVYLLAMMERMGLDKVECQESKECVSCEALWVSTSSLCREQGVMLDGGLKKMVGWKQQ